MRIRLVTLVLLGLISLAAHGEPGFYESEPNNTPADFHAISGEITLYGTMVGQDQDGYLWTVTDDQSRRKWTFELHGEPGALTIVEVVRLQYAENGVDVSGAETLFRMGTRDGAIPSIHRELMFEPGEYVLGLAQSGAGKAQGSGSPFRPSLDDLSFGAVDGEEAASGEGNAEPGAYRLLITDAGPINPSANPGPRTDRENAYGLRLASSYATFESEATAWYELSFNETQAQHRWDLHVQAPIGRPLKASLYDAAGMKLSEAPVSDKGRLRFPDLVPPVGSWYLELTSARPGHLHAITTETVGRFVDGEEAEPNGTHALANRVDLSRPVTGRIGGDDSYDFLSFTPGEEAADQLMTLAISSEPPANLTLCLADRRTWNSAQCRSGTTPFELPDLMLAGRDWGLSIGRASETAYTLTLRAQGAPQAGTEFEPNESPEYASGVPDNYRIKGRFVGKDTDFYQVMVTGEPQLWRFQVIGDNIFEVGYYDGSKKQKTQVRAASGQRRVRLENLFLMPGRHFIRVAGLGDGDYTLLARALGPPDPNGEMEPNDASNKQRLAVGQTRTGLGSDKDDQEFYRFFVGHWDHLRLTVTPAPDGLIAPNVYWYTQIVGQGMPDTTGEPIVMQGLFPPGDYHVVLNHRELSDGEYKVSLERLPRWSCPADCEPNGHGLIWLAAPLPPDLVLEGDTGDWRDLDYYRLPAFDQPTELEILGPAVGQLAIGVHGSDKTYPVHDAELGGYQVTVPPGDARMLMIAARGTPYRLTLRFPNGELEPVTEALPVDLALDFEADEVSAYRIHGQRVAGTLAITNSGPEPLDLRLEAVSSDHRWRVALAGDRQALGPGERRDVGIELTAPPDAWADRPVRISTRAVDSTGRQEETSADITVGRETLPVNPVMAWAAPPALRGGLNVAWAPFGATWTGDTPKWVADSPVIRDNLVFNNVGARSRGDGWEDGNQPELTLELPGDQPLPVRGTAITHFGSPGPFFDIREASLLLSLDGVQFEEVLRFETLPIETIQYFALPDAVPARFARLRIHSTFRDPGSHRETMAEWKVILDPAFDISGGAGFNIADPALGGHLAWDWPPKPYAPRGVLTPDDGAVAAHLQREALKTYVVGFNQNRAARIANLDWTYAGDTRDGTRNFDRVEVSVSIDSPVGPWRSIGELEISPDDATGALALPEPVWARFVRFNAHLAEGASGATAPGQIRVFERPQGEDYRSVLGEWDEFGPSGFFEFQQGLRPEATLVDADHTTREHAAPLVAGSAVRGQVSLGKQAHWYRLAVPAGENTLTITLEGDPSVRTVVELEDAAGDPIPLRRTDQGSVRQHRFEAVVEPGSQVWLHVLEPPRNVIFSWDTSASVNAFIPLINNALVAFSSQVVPGREAVNLMPFSMGLLMKEWYGEPYVLQSILNDFRRGSSSSSAEETLKNAARELAPRAGTKAIVVITDGHTVHDGGMWGPMQEANPRIFSVQVAGAHRWNQDVMRDWADINGGHFTQLRYDGEMEVAFDRAATLMHRPAGYTLQVDSEFREAPGPGLLSVVALGAPTSGGAAVALILDASGSMLQRLDGKRRIAIAKEVLTEAVNEHIPPGTPVALRVFGHREVDSCRTDLELPLAPLDPAAATSTIAGINAMNLARTPIADSLAAVKSDLQGASGTIVLVTDGEETCDGDPGAAIQALRDEGFDVTLNIVGFAIDDVALAAQFKDWAGQSGGRYFGAGDQDGLNQAIVEALRVSFTVRDAGGNEVATGQVGGEPVELERGIYTVVVSTAPEQVFEGIEIVGEDAVSLDLE